MEQSWSCQAEVFKNEPGRLQCTLLAFQGEGHAEPWLIVTDLGPEVAQASWYGLRGWIEQGYKRVKGEGWNLPRTRISTCERLERLWLAVAVATMWVLEVGGEAEEKTESLPGAKAGKKTGEDTPQLPALVPSSVEAEKANTRATTPSPRRIWSVFGRGWNVLRNALAVGLLMLGSWHPEPWPNHPTEGLPPTPATVTIVAEQGCIQARPANTRMILGIHGEDST